VSTHPRVARLAVVGHSNSGKTSLLRTLLRDAAFGEVSPRAGTTRSVAAAALRAGQETVAIIHDSPGLEDPEALARALQATGEAGTPREALVAWLAAAPGDGALEQEARVVALALECDLLLCVLDAREPPRGRLLDEVRLLQMAGRPVVPVLNFTADAEARPAQWREALAALHLHSTVDFDTVLFDAAGERRLYRKLQAQLDSHADAFERLIESRAGERALLRDAALARIAQLMAQAAALGVVVESADAAQRARAVTALQQALTHAEEACALGMVEDFRHLGEGLEQDPLAVVDAPWRLDLHAPGVLERLGLRTGQAAAAGAAIGVGIDLLTGGLTLGAASGLGAGAGALVASLLQYGKRGWQWLRGQVTLVIEHDTVVAVGLRQLALLQALEQRGHASLAPIRVGQVLGMHRPKTLAGLVEAGRRLPPLDPATSLSTRPEEAERQSDWADWADWMDTLRRWHDAAAVAATTEAQEGSEPPAPRRPPH
jgi:GTPase SAR1 family protein